MLASMAVPADADNIPGICDDLYESCVKKNCSQDTGFRARLCRMHCAAERILCEVQRMRDHISDAIGQALRWLVDHPHVAIGTVLVFAGITLIVVAAPAGGLAVILA